ncbi:hypothetical protein Zmor_004489 [Zophobas morio]|uniref:NOT2/NOT3/NOT5 C-terminal domain-containing protein n=1 Tax=Zophobas morio TaxID=2755281 RepID=A0AA38HI69_9CUCU|nr:hypothetical protein Zmor_004489 [Zophobas morio]
MNTGPPAAICLWYTFFHGHLPNNQTPLSQPPALPLATSKIKHLPEECLFYIFYAMPRDVLQQAAAAELYNRDWRFHRTLKLWFTRMMDSGQTGEPPEKSSFVYFDVVTWQKVIIALHID